MTCDTTEITHGKMAKNKPLAEQEKKRSYVGTPIHNADEKNTRAISL